MSYISLEKIIEFRHKLHRFPELSGFEQDSQKRIIDFLNKLTPDELIETGQKSVFKGIYKQILKSNE